MANPKGIITRKDIVDDEAMRWGEVYAENIKEAVKQNNILVDSVKTLNKQVQAFKVANSQKDYITAKQAEALATQQAIDAIKKQEAAEISADKIKRSAIATMEAERKAKQAVTDAENKAQKVKEASKKLTIEERVQNEINNKVLKQEALERLGLVSAYTKLNASRTEAKKKLLDLIASENASTAEIKKAQKEYDFLDVKVRKADAAVGDFTKNVGNYPFKNITSGLQNLIGAFGVTGGIAAFAGIMKGAYETIKKFEQGLADLSAITGASGKDLDYLKKQAIELGKSTKGGAIAVVEAYKLIGSAKPELLENVQALNQVTEATLTLSKAAGMEMPEAATALTDAMNQFGADASQASMFIDALANGAKYGAAEIPQTTEALLKFGAVARSSNVNIKESTALIQLLAENGIKGADAGTALRNVLLKISAPDALPKEAQKSLKDLGISFELLKDKSIPIQEKFEALKPLLADNGKLLKAFGFENVVAARNIIEHTDRLKDLTAKMGEVGTAEEQAAIRTNTINAGYDFLISQIQSFTIKTGEASNVIKTITSAFKFLGNNIEEIITVIGYSIAGWGAYKASLLLANVQQKLMALNLTTTTTVQTVNTVATEAGTAAQIVNAEATTVATTAWERFNLALKANFLGLLIAGLVAAIYYMDKFKVSLKQQNEEVSNSTNKFLENREVVAKNEITLNKLADRYDVLTGKSKLNRSEQDELNKIIKILSKTVPDAVTEFDKYGDALAINTKKVRGYTESQKELIGLQTKKELKDNIDLLSKLKKEQQEFNDLTNSKVSEQVSLTYIEDLGYLERRNGKILKYNEYLMTTRELTDEERIAWKKAVVANEQNIASTESRIKQLKGLSKAKKDAIEKTDTPPTDKTNTGSETDAERKKREAKEKQLADSEYELQKQRLERRIKLNDDVAKDEAELDSVRITAVENSQKEQERLLILSKNHLLEIEKLSYQKELEENKGSKANIALVEKNYVNNKLKINEDFSNKLIDLNQKTKEDIDKINQFDFASYQASLDEGIKKNEIAMNSELAAENERFKALQDLGFKNEKEKEDATRAHEQRLFDIKKEFAIATANLQVANLEAELAAFKAQSDGSKESNKIILETEKKLSEARLKLTELGLETFVKGEEQKAKSAKEQAREILQVSKDMTGALANLANAFSEQKLQSIDAEISANDEYYAHQIELAGDDARKKDLLQKEQKKKNDELEKKKREEQTKQAKFNKAIAIAQASINLALAITAALATAPPASFALAAITAVLAGIELAAVIATPIPKYKGGRKGGPAELAYVGDGGRHEIIERASGIIQMTPATDTLVKLEQDDIVHSSIEDYYKLQRAALLTSIDIQGRKVSDFQASQIFKSHNKELVEEMRLTRKAIEKNKSNIIFNAPKLDINYHLWKMKNTNWN